MIDGVNMQYVACVCMCVCVNAHVRVCVQYVCLPVCLHFLCLCVVCLSQQQLAGWSEHLVPQNLFWGLQPNDSSLKRCTPPSEGLSPQQLLTGHGRSAQAAWRQTHITGASGDGLWA